MIRTSIPRIGITVKPLSETMRLIAERMGKSVRQNFTEGGRPSWIPTKRNLMSPLLGSGKLFGSITESSGDKWAEVSSGLSYSMTHQRGASYVPTLRAAKFFWAKWYESGKSDLLWKNMAIAASHGRTFTIPARPYMVIQPEDMEYIMDVACGHRINVTITE